MNNLREYYELPNKINSVLIIGDTNYYSDLNVEVEIISSIDVPCQRIISLDDFLNKKKRLFYFKYDTIILEQSYIEKTLYKIIHYFSEHKFQLNILIDNNYKIEENYEIISLFENSNFDSQIIERENDILIIIKRW